jgi:hypothetical protein
MRRTIRPNTHRFLVVVIFLLGIVTWLVWELGRLPWGRAVMLAASVTVFVFFAHGWVTR